MDPTSESGYTPRPSITNIIGIMNEGFLPSYYAKLVATYAVENLAGIKYQSEKFGNETAINALKAIPSRPNPASAIGDEVHDAIDRFFHGDVASDDEFSTPTARQMFRQWRHFHAESGIEILSTEFTVWSYKHGYAGTGDIMARFQDAVWIMDTKTGNRVYPKVAMQCAALANADVILTDDGRELPMPATDKIGVLHVRPRSVKLYELQHAEGAFDAFLGLKGAFDWNRYYKHHTVPHEPLATTEYRFS